MKARIKKTGEIVNVAGVFLDDGILTIDEVEFVSENDDKDNHTEEVTCQLLAQKKRDIEYFPIEITEYEKKVIFDIVEWYISSCEYDYALFDRENEYIEMEAADVVVISTCLSFNKNGIGDIYISKEMSLRVSEILKTLIDHTDTRSGLIYFSFDEYGTDSLD